jgi:hypothetical protein
MKNYAQAILEINQSAQFVLNGDDLTNIEWFNNTTPISVSDIEAKATEIENRDAHIIPRQRAYPSIQEQLDMQYHDAVNGTTTWKDAIAQVKADNPKSED